MTEIETELWRLQTANENLKNDWADMEVYTELLEERIEALEKFARDAGTALVRDGHGDVNEDCSLCRLVERLRRLEIAISH